MDPTAEKLFNYLRDVIYSPAKASLNPEELPEEFREFGAGLKYFADCVIETKGFAQALSRGDLNEKMPSRGNEIAAPLKALHASLKHLTWQSQQIAQGDYSQRVHFMGEFSDSFNMMVELLAERHQALEKQAYRDVMTHLYNRAFGMFTLDSWLEEKKRFSLIFADLDKLKYINDEYGHHEGDEYIINAGKCLEGFPAEAVVCRLGGDEFMLLVKEIDFEQATSIMENLTKEFQVSPYLEDKEFKYSMSYGIVFVDENNELPMGDILSIADERMYVNKRKRKMERRA